MINYGLQGRIYSRLQIHKYCPNVEENCCTASDVTMQKFLWESHSRYLAERYYQTYLTVQKYLLGFSAEAFLLARQLEIDGDVDCKKYAVDYIAMDLNPQTTIHMYQEIKKQISEISNLRKGFYCLLCDGSQ